MSIEIEIKLSTGKSIKLTAGEYDELRREISDAPKTGSREKTYICLMPPSASPAPLFDSLARFSSPTN